MGLLDRFGPFVRTRAGVVVNIGADERALILSIVDRVRDLIMEHPDASTARRLFPPTYHLDTDNEHQAEYHRFMHGELVASRLVALESIANVFAASKGEAMNDDQLLGVVQALNSVRLVLGTLLDIGPNNDSEDVDDDHPYFLEHQLFGYLGFLVAHAVRAIGE
jgi:hypothetical protein